MSLILWFVIFFPPFSIVALCLSKKTTLKAPIVGIAITGLALRFGFFPFFAVKSLYNSLLIFEIVAFSLEIISFILTMISIKKYPFTKGEIVEEKKYTEDEAVIELEKIKTLYEMNSISKHEFNKRRVKINRNIKK